MKEHIPVIGLSIFIIGSLIVAASLWVIPVEEPTLMTLRIIGFLLVPIGLGIMGLSQLFFTEEGPAP